MSEEKKPELIGGRLVKSQLISEDQLQEALRLQKDTGSKIGKELIGQGNIRAFDFYQQLAQYLGLDFVNLKRIPCDPLLLEPEERHNYFKFNAIPWKRDGENVVLAVVKTSPELEAWAAAKYAQHSFIGTSSFDILWSIQKHFAKEDDEDAREALWKNDPQKSAKRLFVTNTERNISILGILLACSLFFFEGSFAVFFLIINIFYATTLLFKIIFFTVGVIVESKRKQQLQSREPPHRAKARDLPIYTLLIPMYKEKLQVVANMILSVRQLDYPKSKLDVKFIVEDDDEETIENIKQLGCESFFEIIRTPYSLPRTKPKACNYALRFARGEYVTIYDADDRLEPEQLRTVLRQFQISPPEVKCVQARLNYYNRRDKLITRFFAIEYSSWFDFMLPGLEALRIPIPLGGTSNHFPLSVLRELYAWDPYNVTEDADLGIRLAMHGYRTAVVDSTTMEEAPIHLKGWMGQRARWIKGYIQTYIVHMRKPLQVYKKLGLKGFLGFSFFVGAPSLVFITIPFVVLFSLFAHFSGITFPFWFFPLAMTNLTVGILSHIILAFIVLAKNDWWDMTLHSLLFPFYWILHSIASFMAVWQLIRRPHFWNKTEHGLCKG